MSETIGCFVRPSGSNHVINMPYPCQNKTICAPYFSTFLPGKYIIELWGSSGCDQYSEKDNSLIYGGFGGYVKATVTFEEETSLYFYIGSKGVFNTSVFGGGTLGGGGSTDVRFIPTYKGEDESLESRFLVAGAGGGSTSYYSGARGGHNLRSAGEKGYFAVYKDIVVTGNPPTGASQTSGGKGYQCLSSCDDGSEGSDGALFHGGSKRGGGGFYGGGGGGWSFSIVSSGAGGSSFANGFSNCPYRSDLPLLEDIVMLGGNESLPSPQDGIEIGHYGSGYARVTAVSGSILLQDVQANNWPSIIPLFVILIAANLNY